MTKFSGEEVALNEVADLYRREGFVVTLGQDERQWSWASQDIAVDLVARRGDETVLIVIKRSSEQPGIPSFRKLPDLAAVTRDIPGTRVDVVSVPDGVNAAVLRELSLEQVKGSELLVTQGHMVAAFVLSASALESTLLVLAVENATHVPFMTGIAAATDLLWAEGVLSPTEREKCQRWSQLRNELVHRGVRGVAPPDVEDLNAFIRFALDQEYRVSVNISEWFFSQFEVSTLESLHAEFGEAVVLGKDRIDAILDERFPKVTPEARRAARTRILEQGSTWIPVEVRESPS